MLETPIPGTDPQGIENLLNGHPYISDLFQQKQYGTDALISISVPVIQNDQVIGAFHSILNADLLVNVPNSDDEEYAQNFLVRRDGELFLSLTDGRKFLITFRLNWKVSALRTPQWGM